ncbi:MAG: hypothetical protein E7I48_09970 [Clostridium celatum]|nr:hypothetical protein [Clostridium celatum]
MYLIYFLSKDGMIPITTAATMKIVTEYIDKNQKNWKTKLEYMKIGYVWR